MGSSRVVMTSRDSFSSGTALRDPVLTVSTGKAYVRLAMMMIFVLNFEIGCSKNEKVAKPRTSLIDIPWIARTRRGTKE